MPTWREARGALDRWRRELRRRVLEPVLVGRRSFRETVLNAIGARGHLIYCRDGDLGFFVDPADRAIGGTLMWQGAWQRAELERAVAILSDAGRLPPQAVFVDVGANIGTQTVYALKTGRFSRAIAFEPEPRNAELLAMNVAVNGMAERVTIVTKAIGDATGTAVLHIHPRNKGQHALGANLSHDGQDSVPVDVVRLDEALAQAGVAPEQVGLVWIDVEGHEPQAVRGLGRYLDAAVPLALEYTPNRYSAASRASLDAPLKAHYRTLHHLVGDTSPRPVDALDPIGDFADVLVF